MYYQTELIHSRSKQTSQTAGARFTRPLKSARIVGIRARFSVRARRCLDGDWPATEGEPDAAAPTRPKGFLEELAGVYAVSARRQVDALHLPYCHSM